MNSVKNKFYLLAVLVWMFIGGCQNPEVRDSLVQPRTLTPPKSQEFVPGEVLVKFHSSLSSKTRDQAIKKWNYSKIRQLNREGLMHLRLREGQSVDAAIDELRVDSRVEFAQPNYLYRLLKVPNDPRFDQLWALKNTGQTISTAGGPDSPMSTGNPGTVGKDIGAESTWEHVTDCSSVTVAVVDSGVNYNHEDLVNNMWDGGVTYPKHGYDFVDDDSDPMDGHGHGTHVAATIGAEGNNGVGSTGVCWRIKIMALRTLDNLGLGSSDRLLRALEFANSQGAKIINLSVGSGSMDTALVETVIALQKSGVVIVAAAGNDGINNDNGISPTYPCNFTMDNVICVAALDQNYNLASFSNYGKTSVDVAAPGVNIVSAWHGTQTDINDPLTSGWSFSSSTSTGWAYQSATLGGKTSVGISNPAGFDNATQFYANSTDDRLWKSFDLSGSQGATVFFNLIGQLATGDTLVFKVRNTSGDPMPSGTTLQSFSGISTGGKQYSFGYDISSHLSAATTLGYNMVTNSYQPNVGFHLSDFYVTKLSHNATTYNVAAGTSMAAPHVAGLAALLKAYNPNFTYKDIIGSLKGGGVSQASLAGKTTTGKAVHALGALTYINAPTGVKAVKQ